MKENKYSVCILVRNFVQSNFLDCIASIDDSDYKDLSKYLICRDADYKSIQETLDKYYQKDDITIYHKKNMAASLKSLGNDLKNAFKNEFLVFIDSNDQIEYHLFCNLNEEMQEFSSNDMIFMGAESDVDDNEEFNSNLNGDIVYADTWKMFDFIYSKIKRKCDFLHIEEYCINVQYFTNVLKELHNNGTPLFTDYLLLNLILSSQEISETAANLMTINFKKHFYFKDNEKYGIAYIDSLNRYQISMNVKLNNLVDILGPSIHYKKVKIKNYISYISYNRTKYLTKLYYDLRNKAAEVNN